MQKKNVYIIDTSAILSGKPLHFEEHMMITTDKISKELTPGGRDYFTFQLLLEKGLKIMKPSEQSIKLIEKNIKKSGEEKRLSEADKELIALAYEIKKQGEFNPFIVTDDYSIQNIADQLQINIQSISQKGITKRFKWERRCRGCGIHIKEDVDACPICGSSIKNIVTRKKTIKKD